MASNKNEEVMETKNAEGSVVEKRVGTVDYQSPAGQEQIETTRDVEVVHQYHPTGADSGSGASATVAAAATSVANSIRSAKDAISGNTNESSK